LVPDDALASRLLRARSFEQASDALDAASPPPKQLLKLVDLLSVPKHGEAGKQVREPTLTNHPVWVYVGPTAQWW